MSSMPDDSGAPEYLSWESSTTADGSGSSGGTRRGRGLLIGGGVAAAAVVVAGGAFAAMSLFGGGPQPAEALPGATTLGYLSLDLDPSASQKIEAIRMLNRFPGLDKELDITSGDDLRAYFFAKAQGEGACPGLSYDGDVAPWIGDRFAMAAVDLGEKEPAPVAALHLGDPDRAAQGLEKLATCDGGEPKFGFTIAGDYALVSDTEEMAEKVAQQVESGALADDTTFQRWQDELGEPGVISAYASPAGARFLIESPEFLTGFAGPRSSVSGAALAPEAGRTNPAVPQQLEQMLQGFEGMAATVRFADGALETELVAGGMPQGMSASSFGDDAASSVGSLPDDTAVAFGLAFGDDWLTPYLTQSLTASGAPLSVEDLYRQAEAQTGLDLPADIETLLGDSAAVALSGDVDFEELAGASDPSSVPAGIKVIGDPEQIDAVVGKIRDRLGPAADLMVTEAGDDGYALGFGDDYVSALLENGGLADTAAFRSVVPEADVASSILFVNFDAEGGWLDSALGMAGPDATELGENLEPLDAAGMSTWLDEGDVTHLLVKVTTD